MESEKNGKSTHALVEHRISSLSNEEPVESQPMLQRSFVRQNEVFYFFFGNLDLEYFIMPFTFFRKWPKGQEYMRFRRNYEFTPLLMTILLGLQHACAALSAVIVPAFALRSMYYEYFDNYVLQASVIIAGICTIANSLQLKILRVPFQFGTGLLSVVTNSVVFVPVFVGCMYRLRVTDNVSIHDAYGRMLCTSIVMSLFYFLFTLIPRRRVKRFFPPLVCGVVIVLMGLEFMIQAIQLWGGGIYCSNPTARHPPFLDTSVCWMNGDVHLPFGAAEYLGLGFFVIVLFILFELFGSPFLRHNIISISVLLVFAISAIVTKDSKHYVNGDTIDDTPAVAMLWTTVYKLKFYDGAVMPLLGAFIVTYLESTAALTATLEESRIDITEVEADHRIQGGLIAAAVGSFFSVLATGFPVTPTVLNSSIIGMTGQASSAIGVSTGVWLLLFGIFGKFFAIYLEIPGCIKGATGVLIYAGVIWTGMKILARERYNRRTKFIAIISMTFGLARILAREVISENLWIRDPDMADFWISFRYAIICLMRVSSIHKSFAYLEFR
eukprot:g4443.t1